MFFDLKDCIEIIEDALDKKAIKYINLCDLVIYILLGKF